MHREVVTELDNLKVLLGTQLYAACPGCNDQHALQAEEHHLNNIMQHYEAQMEALRAKSQFATTYSSPAAAGDSVSD